MPAKVKVRILAGRNLPVMDKSSDASDAFVEVKHGSTTYKTEVYRRSLNPFWNSEWFRFEVSDQELQDEPLQIRVMDYDTYSANDAIGKVYINLNPLIVNRGRSMSGWLPIYDTLHGIRGEINCMVKVNLFADNNRFRHSSCGVRFFFSDIPNGYKCDAILGFVDELLVNDDPEYKWIDKIRTPRASNEARQTLFTKLSGEVQRKLGLKAEFFGGNAVIGYQQSFDLEGASGIVGRGIGTAVVLSKIRRDENNSSSSMNLNNPNLFDNSYYITNHLVRGRHKSTSKIGQRGNQLVHSVSADYFYELPSPVDSKCLTVTSEVSRLLSNESSDKNNEDDDTNESEYEDCEERLDFESGCSLNNLASDRGHPQFTSRSGRTSLSKLCKLSYLSLSTESAKPIRRSPNIFERRLSASFLIDKLGMNQKRLSQGLSFLNKPYSTRDRLTRLLPFSRKNSRHRNLNSHHDRDECSTTNPKRVVQDVSFDRHHYQSKRAGTETSSTHKSLEIQHQFQSSTTSSRSESPSQSLSLHDSSVTSEPSGSTSGKRRRNKSQSASIEDALSIIEEKVDDDDTQQQQAACQARARLFSGSSGGRSKRMVRTTEIDLNDEMHPFVSIIDQEACSPTTKPSSVLSMSSADDDIVDLDEDIDITNSSPTSIYTSKENALESESPPVTTSSTSPNSSSYLTDETVKQVEGCSLPARSPVTNQLSSPVRPQHTSPSTIRRSESDLGNRTQQAKSSSSGLAVPSDTGGGASSLNRLSEIQSAANNEQVSIKRTNSDLKNPLLTVINQQVMSPSTSTNSFVQSVHAIKAQQHLLQNMIKHQNQNLLVSSMNKAKNAFLYPRRVHEAEYPFVTLKKYPKDMIKCTGGVVSVHSVKQLDHIMNDEESETRDIWWTELRKEIRSHAKALNCNSILGYTETSKILCDICILSASGTAAVLLPDETRKSSLDERSESGHPTGNSLSRPPSRSLKALQSSGSPPPHNSEDLTSSRSNIQGLPDPGIANDPEIKAVMDQVATEVDASSARYSCGATTRPIADCSFCHTPLTCADSINQLSTCTICRVHKVPDILLMTIEPPENLNMTGFGTLVQARICRAKRYSHGEAQAKEIAEALPFLEYELHRQLFSKLKFKGLNCLFDLSIDISVGDNIVAGIATGTGCFVLGLPTPDPPRISAGKGIKASRLSEIQHLVMLSAMKNRELLGLDRIEQQLAKYHEEEDQIRKQLELVNHSCSSLDGDHEHQTIEPSRTDQSLIGINTDEHEPTETESLTNGHTNVARSHHVAIIPSPNQQQQHHRHKHRHTHHHKHNHSNNKQYHRDGAGAKKRPSRLEPSRRMISDDDLFVSNNDIVLEVDDNDDADIIALLIDSDIPDGYLVCNSETIPTISPSSINSINMFTQVMRTKLFGTGQFAQQFDSILQTLFVKLRRSLPCCLTNLNFVVDLPEPNIVQITVTGCLLGLCSIEANSSGVQHAKRTESSQICDNPNDSPATTTTTSTLTGAETNNPANSSAEVGSIGLKCSNGKKKKTRQSTSSSMTPNSSHSNSSSSSSLYSSSSPASSSSSSKKKSSLLKSRNESQKQPALQEDNKPGSPSAASKASEVVRNTLTKTLSKTNLGALLNVGRSNLVGSSEKRRRRSAKESDTAAPIEMIERSATWAKDEGQQQQQQSSNGDSPSTKAAKAALKQGVDQCRVGGADSQRLSTQPIEIRAPSMRGIGVRAIFKKQQTYPGANSPQISGHDRLLPFDDAPGGGASGRHSQVGGVARSTAAKRATQLLNKVVKQPLRELSSNFNATSTTSGVVSSSGDAQSQASGAADSATSGGEGHKSGRSNFLHKSSSSAAVGGQKASFVHDQKHQHYQQQSSVATKGPMTSASVSGSYPKASTSSVGGMDGNHVLISAAAAAAAAASKERQTLNSNIDITSLSFIPGAKEYHYLGNLSFSFVRETNSVRENGGLNGFIHCFLMEVYAIVRAHVSALGGNAMLSFRLQHSCVLYQSNKNQAQCLISVAGDAVQVY